MSGEKWNLACPKTQRRVLKLIREERPYLIILSPPCTNVYSIKGSPDWRQALERARVLLRYSMLVCRLQAAAGRCFLFEQALSASSWHDPAVKNMLWMEGVDRVRADMCAYRLHSWDEWGEGAVARPTGLMSNMPALLKGMPRVCQEDHRHVPLLSNRAGPAARYTESFCRQVVTCVEIQQPLDLGAKSADAVFEEASDKKGNDLLCYACNQNDSGKKHRHICLHKDANHDDDDLQWKTFIDDRTGEQLDSKLVARARQEEITTLKAHKVYRTVPRWYALERCRALGIRPIDVRWIDTNMAAPGMLPDIRARCVAKEFASTIRDDLFAATPSLESTKMPLSIAASHDRGRKRKIMVMDIKRAFLHAPILREVYINLPQEAQKGDGELMMGLLHRALYGTRDAPQSWQHHITGTLLGMGFQPGRANPCVFSHGERELVIAVHVDDFMRLGSAADLSWFRGELGKKFEFTSSVLGHGPGEAAEVKYLNRTIRLTSQGIVYEHDEKHIETVMKELGLVTGRGVTTRGVKEGTGAASDQPLTGRDEHKIRRLIAVSNYLSQDRADIGFAVKEAARQMSRPTDLTSRMVYRLARYLKDHPRRPQTFSWQWDPKGICAYTDSDWAGCERTRRSTSGGVIVRGRHVIKAWSRTQAGVALSSGEAELIAAIKGSTELLGLRTLAAEMDEHVQAKVLTDSSAAKGAVTRTGSGRMKHLSVSNLWVQEMASRREIEYVKIPRDANYADIRTHHWDATAGERMLSRMGMACISFG